MTDVPGARISITLPQTVTVLVLVIIIQLIMSA
jgi:hypothetical protein